ncbi:MAG TPA: tRNA (adenosine(37)-N6)-threonylcarbamoyltransferase complex ATPase subunit type 1 TsaE [Cyanothece sp. UBA12306]|nr:tRNA (adenosine(37)-N6)-threonylcarbamoyltransferase complex ATPase subunit type 1 TsaE [Cyanothece sp. UBA12306]
MLVIHLADKETTQRLGRQLGTFLSAGTVILLEGDLGTGKTTLVQGIGQGLGIKEAIVSPTFTLVNEYTEGRLPLYHLDLYRLSTEEIEALYPDLYWEGEEVTPGITAIEWAKKLPYKPLSYLDIKLIYSQEQGRQAIIDLVGKFEFRMKNEE